MRQQLFELRVGTGGRTSYDGNPTGDYHSQPASWNRGMLINHYSGAAYTVGWGATGSDNNGNILRSHHYIPVNDANTGHVVFYQDYLYDSLNRVTRETENTYGGFVFQQSFSYDRWSNRTIDVANTSSGIAGVTNDTFTVNTANNRLTAKNSIPYGYDSAGNQTTFSTLGLNDYEQRDYDAENRMSKAIKNNATNYYFYDASGKRVRRIVNGAQSTTANETWMVYGFEGELVAEYAYNGATNSPQKEYGYRNGQMLIVADNSSSCQKVEWLVTDHLGTPRINIRGTGSDGGSLASVTRHDYLPFGEEVFAGARRNAQNQGQYGYEPPDDGVRQNFTGYERDDETGLDFMQARYYEN